MNLRYFTSDMVEDLRTSIGEHLDWYYEPGDRPYPGKIRATAWRESSVVGDALSGKVDVGGSRPSEQDAANALVVFGALENLTRQQAADERFWVHVSHLDCPGYIASRWLQSRPSRDRDAIRKVQNHFFARGTRGITRDHGVARLWWLGATAHEVHPYCPRLFLDIVLHRQDVRSALIERPSLSMNLQVLRAIFSVMRDYWDSDRNLFDRNVFRSWMTSLNRRGGVLLLDALSEDRLLQLLHTEATDALESAK